MSISRVFRLFIPRYAFREITDVSFDFLEQLGAKLIMLDLDNTLAEYKEPGPPECVVKWVEDLKKQGMEMYIVSNSKRKERVETFGITLGVDVIIKARKPSPKSIFQAINATGATVKESALIGDQVFTDMIAANRAGVISIAVEPRRLTNPVHTIRYWLETPFRAMCKNKLY